MAIAENVTVDRGLVADVLTVTGKAGGVRAIKQTVVLYHGLPRIDFHLWPDKAPFRGVHAFPHQHEAVFVALPLAIPNFTIHHELPGCVMEPYRQQFQGSATDHYAVRSFTDLSSDKYGVTVSPIEGSLVCYGEPTSSPMLYGHEEHFKRDQTYPAASRLYLYLLNNMFDVNIAADQQGPVSFQWALRSHAGGWKAGGADRFGRSVLRPLIAWRADGTNSGPLPAGASFMSVDAPNVTCSVIKPAEANGRGYIIRLNETTGQETTATVSLPLLPAIESATASSLVKRPHGEVRDRRQLVQTQNSEIRHQDHPCHLRHQSGRRRRHQGKSHRRYAGRFELATRRKGRKPFQHLSRHAPGLCTDPVELHRPIGRGQLHGPAPREPRRLAAELPRAKDDLLLPRCARGPLQQPRDAKRRHRRHHAVLGAGEPAAGGRRGSAGDPGFADQQR